MRQRSFDLVGFETNVETEARNNGTRGPIDCNSDCNSDCNTDCNTDCTVLQHNEVQSRCASAGDASCAGVPGAVCARTAVGGGVERLPEAGFVAVLVG